MSRSKQGEHGGGGGGFVQMVHRDLLIIATDIGVLESLPQQAGKWHAVTWLWQQSIRDKPVLRVVFKIKQGAAMAARGQIKPFICNTCAATGTKCASPSWLAVRQTARAAGFQ